ncbi:hypothetical protein D3C74_340520 [compost metagenome]
MHQDVRRLPVFVQKGLLRGRQLGIARRKSGFQLIRGQLQQLLLRVIPRGIIRDEFIEDNGAVLLRLHAKTLLDPLVPRSRFQLVSVAEGVFDAAEQSEIRHARRLEQSAERPMLIRFLRLQHLPVEGGTRSRVASPSLIRHSPIDRRREQDLPREVQRRHFIPDRGQMLAGKRGKPLDSNPQFFARCRLPDLSPYDRPFPHVQPTAVFTDPLGKQIEFLAVHVQLDKFAVRDVQHRLVHPGMAVMTRLRVCDRGRVVKPVQIGAVQRRSRRAVISLLKVAANPDIPVADGKHRLIPLIRLRIERRFRYRPGFEWIDDLT